MVEWLQVVVGLTVGVVVGWTAASIEWAWFVRKLMETGDEQRR